MAYQKTAKDKAWDKERQKLKSEIADWIAKCGQKERTIQYQTGEIALLKQKIEKLEKAIDLFTNGRTSPDEILNRLEKNAELMDMMHFLSKEML